MTTEEVNKEHQKHAKLARPKLGEWGRLELALLGTPCSVIKEFTEKVTSHLSAKWKIAFVDADHHTDGESLFPAGAALHFTDKISYKRIDFGLELTPYQKHGLFNDCDLVLVNGNHFTAQQQIVFINPAKPLEAKLESLTAVQLVILKDRSTIVPDYLKQSILGAPVLTLDETDEIISFFKNYLQQQVALVNGLVLAGGKSARMGTDKSLLNYHGKAQRDYLYELLQPLCNEVYLSCNEEQKGEIIAPKIKDSFLGIGPLGGLLSAFQGHPDKAWLTVACDMPFLTQKTLNYLVAHRNPSKMATAFMNADEKFPEPLITIWEPRAYPILLQALSEGYSCPRKVLINSDVAILHAPDANELQNVNDPAAYTLAAAHIGTPFPHGNVE